MGSFLFIFVSSLCVNLPANRDTPFFQRTLLTRKRGSTQPSDGSMLRVPDVLEHGAGLIHNCATSPQFAKQEVLNLLRRCKDTPKASAVCLHRT